MRRRRSVGALRIVAALVLLAGLILIAASTYVLDETEQAVVVEFGRPVGGAVTEPGLHFKKPFVQSVRRFEKRLLAWDGDPNQIPTRGREFISIDTTARWRIADPLRFLERVQDEAGAQSRLDDIIDSVVRDEISGTELVEIVRSRGWEVEEEVLEEVVIESEEAMLEREIQIGREGLTRRILTEASKKMPEFGIELVDVRIKRIDYIPSVRRQVFNRMISERQRVAERFRSEGRGKSAEIRGETRRQEKEIRSQAERESEVIRGQADARATAIYNEAYSADPEFYAFYRTLRSYPGTVGQQTVLVLDSGGEYFRFLERIAPAAENSQSDPD